MVHVLRQRPRHPAGRRADDGQREVSARGDARRARRAAARRRQTRSGCRCGEFRFRRRVRTRCTSARWPTPSRRALCAEGFTHMAFGDLFLEDIRRYREEKLAGTGLTPIFPLFGVDTTTLRARDGRRRPAGAAHVRESEGCSTAKFAGRDFDASLPRRAAGVASIPCGERGEFHSFAYAGPMFSKPIAHRVRRGRRARRLRLRRRPPMTDNRRLMPDSRIGSSVLTEETTETLYLLGQGDRIVGVSGYTVRPPEARQKPKVSAFINAQFDKIDALQPDLVLAFSDLQADLVAELRPPRHRRRHVQPAQRRRDPSDDPDARRPRRLSDARPRRSPSELERGPRRASATSAARFRVAPARRSSRSGTSRSSRASAGSRSSSRSPAARRSSLSCARRRSRSDRIVDPAEVARRDPEVVFASWCGKKMKKATIQSRPGWDRVSAVRDDRIFEIKSTYTSCSRARRA